MKKKPNEKNPRRGNPVFAMRVDKDTLRAYVKLCGGMREAQDKVRRHMQVTLNRGGEK